METLSRDVLPAGVRRRLSRRDGRLPAILMGELMAGMALGMVWPVLTAPPPPVPQTAMTAVQAPVPMVPQASQLPPLVHVPKHAPRNPFGVPQGIDASSLPPVGSLSQPPVGSVPVPGVPPAPVAAVPQTGNAVPPPPLPAGPDGAPVFGDDGSANFS